MKTLCIRMSYSFNGVMRDLIDLHGWWKEGFDNYNFSVMSLLQYWLCLFLNILSIVQDNTRRPTLFISMWPVQPDGLYNNKSDVLLVSSHRTMITWGAPRSDGTSAGRGSRPGLQQCDLENWEALSSDTVVLFRQCMTPFTETEFNFLWQWRDVYFFWQTFIWQTWWMVFKSGVLKWKVKCKGIVTDSREEIF